MAKRKVLLEVTIQWVREYDDDRPAEDINFQLNEGSWCADNVLDEIKAELEGREEVGGCLCSVSTARYVREATPEDISWHQPWADTQSWGVVQH